MSGLALALMLSAEPAPPAVVIGTPPPPVLMVPSPAPPPPPPAAEEGAARPPIHVEGTITNDDYPAAAIRAEEQGTVTERLQVGADGRVESCSVSRSSGSAMLDSTTCSLMTTRFRFEPARDRRGRAVAGSVTRNVRWELPEGWAAASFMTGLVGAIVPPLGGTAPCSLLLSAVELVPLGTDLCGEVFPPEAEGGADRAPAIALLTLAAGSDQWLERPPLEGTLRYAEEARFEVLPDGTVVGCTHSVTQNSRNESPFDLCRFLDTEDGPFFQSRGISADGPLGGRIRLDVYDLAAPFDPPPR